MKHIKSIISASVFSVFLLTITTTSAQTGGNYQITQSVFAAGESNSSGGTFTLDSIIGQPLAGTNSTGGSFSVQSGFLIVQLAPTAAPVSISGRVFSGKGTGIIRRVRISLLDTMTGIERTTQTNQIGFYQFDQLEIGRFYIVRAESRNYSFSPDNYTFELLEDRQDVNFTGSRTLLPNQN